MQLRRQAVARSEEPAVQAKAVEVLSEAMHLMQPPPQARDG